MRLRLYHYWRSSSSWRVRWALALKNLSCEYVDVDLLSGESESEEHLKRNPMGFVPVLELLPNSPKDGPATSNPVYLTESTAIIEWLEETHPTPPLLPGDPLQRARIRQLAQIINAGTQPLQNLSTALLHSDDPEKRKIWSQHWIRAGLGAYESIASQTAGRFSVGDTLTLADLCLIPQCYNAKRNDVAIEDYPVISRIVAAASEIPTYKSSSPESFQPSAKR